MFWCVLFTYMTYYMIVHFLASSPNQVDVSFFWVRWRRAGECHCDGNFEPVGDKQRILTIPYFSPCFLSDSVSVAKGFAWVIMGVGIYVYINLFAFCVYIYISVCVCNLNVKPLVSLIGQPKKESQTSLRQDIVQTCPDAFTDLIHLQILFFGVILVSFCVCSFLVKTCTQIWYTLIYVATVSSSFR